MTTSNRETLGMWCHFYTRYHYVLGASCLILGLVLYFYDQTFFSLSFIGLGLWSGFKANRFGISRIPLTSGEERNLQMELDKQRNLEMISLLLGVVISLASIFYGRMLQAVGIPMAIVSAFMLIITLKTHWEISICLERDNKS